VDGLWVRGTSGKCNESTNRIPASSAKVPSTAMTSSSSNCWTRSAMGRSFITRHGNVPFVSSSSTSQWPLAVERMSEIIPMRAASLPPAMFSMASVGRWFTRPRSLLASFS